MHLFFCGRAGGWIHQREWYTPLEVESGGQRRRRLFASEIGHDEGDVAWQDNRHTPKDRLAGKAYQGCYVVWEGRIRHASRRDPEGTGGGDVVEDVKVAQLVAVECMPPLRARPWTLPHSARIPRGPCSTLMGKRMRRCLVSAETFREEQLVRFGPQTNGGSRVRLDPRAPRPVLACK